MAVYKRSKNYKPKTPLDQIVVPTEYWGMKAISKRMNASQHRIKRLAIKYGFPLLRLPSVGARGWTYYTAENLILLWELGLIQHTRRYLLETKLTGTDAIRENQSILEPIAQLIENTKQSSIQESSCEQPSTAESLVPSSIEEFSGAQRSRGEGES